MPKTITKEYVVYDLEDLKKDDELCDRIYQKFWIDSPDIINSWADENIDSFKKFAETLNMPFDYCLSNAEYPDRSNYVRLDASNYDYVAPSKRAERIAKSIEGYKGNGYCFCIDLKEYAEKLVAEWHKDYSIHDFTTDIQHKMWELWFQDNQYYFSKESFLNMVEGNEWEFCENGRLA